MTSTRSSVILEGLVQAIILHSLNIVLRKNGCTSTTAQSLKQSPRRTMIEHTFFFIEEQVCVFIVESNSSNIYYQVPRLT